MAPSYEEEAALLDQGYSLIAGLDEVGRGPWRGLSWRAWRSFPLI